MPAILGLHHVKVPVSDLPRSRDWHERLLGVRLAVEFRDDDGAVRGVAYEPIGAFTPSPCASARPTSPPQLPASTRSPSSSRTAQPSTRGSIG
jgi:catechol 2,3-dioxygenase-like lactoylglutathione lyase family enzyme